MSANWLTYEWAVEWVTTAETDEFEVGEVLDSNHFDSYALAASAARKQTEIGTAFRVVLIREDRKGRAWAYVQGDALPSHFLDEDGDAVAKVPRQFATEVSAFRIGGAA